MPSCQCLVLIPNPRGESLEYAVVAKSSMEAAQKAMQAHPYPVPVDAVITVIADGLAPAHAGASEHNARQPTFWHRAGMVLPPVRKIPRSPKFDSKRRKNLLN